MATYILVSLVLNLIAIGICLQRMTNYPSSYDNAPRPSIVSDSITLIVGIGFVAWAMVLVL